MNYWDYAGKTFDLPHRTRSRFSGSTNLDYLTHFRTHKETPISFVSKTDKLFLTTHPTCTITFMEMVKAKRQNIWV